VKQIIQFGYRVQQPVQGWPVVDCRVIPNPYMGFKATAVTSDEEYKAKARAHPQFEPLVREAIAHLLKGNVVQIGCLFGRHRSGAVAEEVQRRMALGDPGYEVKIHQGITGSF